MILVFLRALRLKFSKPRPNVIGIRNVNRARPSTRTGTTWIGTGPAWPAWYSGQTRSGPALPRARPVFEYYGPRLGWTMPSLGTGLACAQPRHEFWHGRPGPARLARAPMAIWAVGEAGQPASLMAQRTVRGIMGGFANVFAKKPQRLPQEPLTH